MKKLTTLFIRPYLELLEDRSLPGNLLSVQWPGEFLAEKLVRPRNEIKKNQPAEMPASIAKQMHIPQTKPNVFDKLITRKETQTSLSCKDSLAALLSEQTSVLRQSSPFSSIDRNVDRSLLVHMQNQTN